MRLSQQRAALRTSIPPPAPTGEDRRARKRPRPSPSLLQGEASEPAAVIGGSVIGSASSLPASPERVGGRGGNADTGHVPPSGLSTNFNGETGEVIPLDILFSTVVEPELMTHRMRSQPLVDQLEGMVRMAHVLAGTAGIIGLRRGCMTAQLKSSSCRREPPTSLAG